MRFALLEIKIDWVEAILWTPKVIKQTEKSMNPLVFWPNIIDNHGYHVSSEISVVINCAKLFSRINTVGSALKDLLFWIRHVFMISNRIVGADFGFFSIFRFFSWISQIFIRNHRCHSLYCRCTHQEYPCFSRENLRNSWKKMPTSSRRRGRVAELKEGRWWDAKAGAGGQGS